MSNYNWESLEFGKWPLLVDPGAIRTAHEQIPVGSPEACGCRNCRNFAAARGRVYPPEVVALMQRLGINPSHETEIYQMNRLKPGLHLYGGFFHFVGMIDTEGDTVGPFDMEQGDEAPFRMFFAHGRDLLPSSFGTQIVTRWNSSPMSLGCWMSRSRTDLPAYCSKLST